MDKKLFKAALDAHYERTDLYTLNFEEGRIIIEMLPSEIEGTDECSYKVKLGLYEYDFEDEEVNATLVNGRFVVIVFKYDNKIEIIDLVTGVQETHPFMHNDLYDSNIKEYFTDGYGVLLKSMIEGEQFYEYNRRENGVITVNGKDTLPF